MQTEELLEAANLRLGGPLKAIDLNRDRKLIEAGFRDEDERPYVARIVWKKVRYGGKTSINFVLEVFSFNMTETEKRPVARLNDGKVRPMSLPRLHLEATRSFKQEVPND